MDASGVAYWLFDDEERHARRAAKILLHIFHPLFNCLSTDRMLKVSFFLVTLGHCFTICRKWPAAFWLEIELNLYLITLSNEKGFRDTFVLYLLCYTSSLSLCFERSLSCLTLDS